MSVQTIVNSTGQVFNTVIPNVVDTNTKLIPYSGGSGYKAIEQIENSVNNTFREIRISDRFLTSSHETYYRTLSQEHFDILKNTGRMPAGYKGETFVSPSLSYVQRYDYGGVTLEFKLNPGTTNKLMDIGVKNRGGGVMLDTNYNYSKLLKASKNWGNENAIFKLEQKILDNPLKLDKYNVNIGLGKENGKALDIFNNNIIEYRIMGE